MINEEKIEGDKITEWKEKYYSGCYCLEGRCYYNKCDGKKWKNIEVTWIKVDKKKYIQLELF